MTANNQVNVATTKEASLFPDIHLPSGISTKATKYREMAKEGEEWRSPIFDLGTATATSNIPAPKKITRKSPHQNSRATINDRKGTATSSVARGPQNTGRGYQDAGQGANAGYTSLNSAGDTGNTGSYIPSSNGYQPRMSSAADSMRTAVEQEDFEGTHVGKYNVTGSQLHQDPISMSYKGAKNTNEAS